MYVYIYIYIYIICIHKHTSPHIHAHTHTHTHTHTGHHAVLVGIRTHERLTYCAITNATKASGWNNPPSHTDGGMFTSWMPANMCMYVIYCVCMYVIYTMICMYACMYVNVYVRAYVCVRTDINCHDKPRGKQHVCPIQSVRHVISVVHVFSRCSSLSFDRFCMNTHSCFTMYAWRKQPRKYLSLDT